MADKKNVAALAPKDESVADILSAIKGIVEGDAGNNNTVAALDNNEDEDFLELTDVVENIENNIENNDEIAAENNSNFANDANFEAVAESKNNSPKDILDEIDSAIGVTPEGAGEEDQKSILEQLMKTLDPNNLKPAEPVVEEVNVEDTKIEDITFDQFKPISEFDEVITAEPEVKFEVAPTPAPAPLIETKIEAKPEPIIATPEIIQPLIAPNPIKTNLLSAEMAQKSHLAIQNLLNNIPKPEILSPAMRNGTTIEDVVVESMKPLLKEWLDQNLEILVRDIVEREIKKLLPHE
jgi:uncharacterized protein